MMTSAIAIMHGMRVDWRWDAPRLARALGLEPPREVLPYLDEWVAKHPVIINRDVMHQH